MPSILRNSRYRREQRQIDEEEEMWFNEDDDFDETVIPTTNDVIGNTKKLDPELDSIGKIIDAKKPEPNHTKLVNTISSLSIAFFNILLVGIG